LQNADAEYRLWKAVMLSAIKDVVNANTSPDLARAVLWFKTRQAEDICSLIGYEIGEVKRIVFKLSKRSRAQRRYYVKEIFDDKR